LFVIPLRKSKPITARTEYFLMGNRQIVATTTLKPIRNKLQYRTIK